MGNHFYIVVFSSPDVSQAKLNTGALVTQNIGTTPATVLFRKCIVT
jgi:hypothetical protein